MMTPSNRKIFRLTDHLCAEFTGHRWIHIGQERGALVFSLICAWTNGWASNRDAGDQRRHRAHHDGTVMCRMDLTDDESTIDESVESAQCLNYSEIQNSRIPSYWGTYDGQILKNQYNDTPRYKYQPDITLVNTVIYLLGRDLIGFKPYHLKKVIPIISQNTLG